MEGRECEGGIEVPKWKEDKNREMERKWRGMRKRERESRKGRENRDHKYHVTHMAVQSQTLGRLFERQNFDLRFKNKTSTKAFIIYCSAYKPF